MSEITDAVPATIIVKAKTPRAQAGDPDRAQPSPSSSKRCW
jgi:hypothetical protein